MKVLNTHTHTTGNYFTIKLIKERTKYGYCNFCTSLCLELKRLYCNNWMEKLKNPSHLWGVNGGLILHDFQRALDPGISVGVSSGWTVEVKDHQFVCLTCQLEVSLQAADRLVSCLLLVLCSQRANCTKWIVLEEITISKLILWHSIVASYAVSLRNLLDYSYFSHLGFWDVIMKHYIMFVSLSLCDSQRETKSQHQGSPVRPRWT